MSDVTAQNTIDYAAPPQRLTGAALVVDQTWTLLVDAYRQLQARKLFWITLILSALVAASFSLVGINASGLKILWFDLESPLFNTSVISEGAFYKLLFVTLGVSLWLAWAAIILALISTSGMIPELVSDGSIDLYLSKPLGRTRLLLTKYVSGLMFAALQTLCFCVACFLVIGIRGGAWEPTLFWAVPIVTAFFSFLYAIAALVGLVTGSTLAAILVTLLAWVAMFAANTADTVILQQVKQKEIDLERTEATMEYNRQRLERMAEQGIAEGAGITTQRAGLELAREQREATIASTENWQSAHRWVLGIRSVLPKTGEVLSQLDRALLPKEEMSEFQDQMRQETTEDIRNEQRREAQQKSMDASIRADYAYRERSIWWTWGTSLGFEAVMLGLAAWIFARRDF